VNRVQISASNQIEN